MSMLIIRTAKAGQGASVTAAIATATTGRRTLLVDASTGDLPAIVGIAEPDMPGLTHYLTDPNSPSVDRLIEEPTSALEPKISKQCSACRLSQPSPPTPPSLSR